MRLKTMKQWKGKNWFLGLFLFLPISICFLSVGLTIQFAALEVLPQKNGWILYLILTLFTCFCICIFLAILHALLYTVRLSPEGISVRRLFKGWKLIPWSE